jgi:hypothetical protein
MAVQLRKGGYKLLNIVNGQRHACNDDHEEPQRKRHIIDDDLIEPHRKRLRSPISREVQVEEDINAEPQSSDDEIRDPQPRTSRASLPIPSVVQKATVHGDDELKAPQRKSARKQADSADTKGKFIGKTVKGSAKKKRAEDKENDSSAIAQSSSGSVEDNPWNFALEHTSQQPAKGTNTNRTTFGRNTTGNIHAQRPARKFGGVPAPRVPKHFVKGGGRAEKSTKHTEEEDEDEDIEMVDEQPTPGKESDPELRKWEHKKKPKGNFQVTRLTLNDHELDELLQEPTKEPADTELKSPPRRAKPTVLHDHLGDWQAGQASESSQHDSSAPHEALDSLNNYIEQLPQEEEEGSRCHICKALVGKEEYWDYWIRKDKTVRNQNAFCRAHRTKSAWDEYRSEGYPDIDWTALPHRIQKHRMELFKILNNVRPSGYRDRYEPIALTGKAAAVPSRRDDLPEHIREELQSYALDDQSTYPGYYGPHGRRIITEHVMKVLKNEIKNCSDAVVQGSGPATFVQAVLVPETAILLIMEDCRVDREEAEEIREKTYDMGMLLNEEIEDQVEANYPSDDENEYCGR